MAPENCDSKAFARGFLFVPRRRGRYRLDGRRRTHWALSSPTSSRSIGNSARASCCRRPACLCRTAAQAFARSQRVERARAGPVAISYAQPRDRRTGMTGGSSPTAPWAAMDNRRRRRRSIRATLHLRRADRARDRRAALAARPHLGGRARQSALGEALRRQPHRPARIRRTRRRGPVRAVQRCDGPRRRGDRASRRHTGSYARSARRRRRRWGVTTRASIPP